MIYNSIGVLLNRTDIWHYKLDEVKKFIDINKNRPTLKSNKLLFSWLSHQLNNYKKQEQIMSYEKIRNIWYEFINDENYKIYFICNEDAWSDMLEQTKKFIDINKNRPTEKSNKLLCYWLCNQLTNYKKQERILSNEKIRNIWYEIINDENYKQYFKSNKNNCYDILE